jgi:hypothetical protein
MAKLVNICLGERADSVQCVSGELDLKVGDFCIINLNGREQTGFVRGFTYGTPACAVQCRIAAEFSPADSSDDDSSDNDSSDDRSSDD